MSFFTSLFAFLFAIAVLVAIHEFGHYWVAKQLGVKVLRFSIGFGRPLWRRVAGKDQTEYVVAAIPLGGYVKMLDEREGEVPAAELDRAFNRQPVGKRIAIVAAGPIFNFLFAIVLYAVMYMVGVNGIKPMIGEVLPGSIAEQAGLQAGEEIVAVNGRPTKTWENAALAMINGALNNGSVLLTLADQEGYTEERRLDLSDARNLLKEGNTLDNIGIKPWRPKIPAVLAEVVPGGAADRAGLRAGDRVIEMGGIPIVTWEDLVAQVHAHPNQSMDVIIERQGEQLELRLKPEQVTADGQVIGRIGVRPVVDPKAWQRVQVNVSYGPLESLAKGVTRTWDMSILTLRVMWKMITGEASLKNVSGPLTIAEFAGMSALVGLSAFLGFLGIVSVSLGVLNLLPVPVLDGGHLLFYVIELIRGQPLSEAVEALGQRIGLAILGGLMLLAFYNDLTRLLN